MKTKTERRGLFGFIERHLIGCALFELVSGTGVIWWAGHIDTVASWLRFLFWDHAVETWVSISLISFTVMFGGILWIGWHWLTGRFWEKSGDNSNDKKP